MKTEPNVFAREWAMRLLFPVLLISFAFAQERPIPFTVAVGQLASVAGTLIALVVLATSLPRSVWPAWLFAALFILRGVRFAVVDKATLDVMYVSLSAALATSAGALIATRRPGLLRRQFAVFCALSAPLMLLQVVGVPWTQLLRTDLDPPELGFQQVRTLFVPAGQVVVTTLQSRPAGILFANNAASMVAAFGMALHFSRLREPGRISWRDLAVLSASVLLMSKLVYVVLIVLWLILTLTGSAPRRHVAGCAAVTVVLLILYRVLFPGLFDINLSWYAFFVDLETRVADLLVATGIPALAHLAGRIPHELFGGRRVVLQAIGAGTMSGYSLIAQNARVLVPAFVVCLPYAWFAFRTAARFDRVTRQQVASVAVAALLVLAITPFLNTFMFWFLSAAAWLPVWQFFDRSFMTDIPATGDSTARTLWRHARWVALAGAVGVVAGALVARTAPAVYQAASTVTFENDRANEAQVRVISESVDAVLRSSGFTADIERAAGLRVRRLWAEPAGRNAVSVNVQASADPERVTRAAQVAAQQVNKLRDDAGIDRATTLPTAGAVFGAGRDRGRIEGRIDQQVADRVPPSIVAAVRPWYLVPVRAESAASPASLIQQRFALAGVLIGIGLAVAFVASSLGLSKLREEARAAHEDRSA